MKQWLNDALLLVSSALFVEQLVDYVNPWNQTRLCVIILIKSKPPLANHLNLVQDKDSQADDLALMIKQTFMSRHDEAILSAQVHLLIGRLRKIKTREEVALMRTRVWRERREFLHQEQDKLDKKHKEYRRSIEYETVNNHSNHLKSLEHALDTAEDKLVSEVRLLREESKTIKKILKALIPTKTSQRISKLQSLTRVTSEESRRMKAQMENTLRRLEAINASHSRFMMHQSQTHKELRVMTTGLRVRTKLVKLICSKYAKVNQLARRHLESRRQEDVARLQEGLVQDQDEQRCRNLGKYLKGMAAVLIVEGIACLTYVMMYDL